MGRLGAFIWVEASALVSHCQPDFLIAEVKRDHGLVGASVPFDIGQGFLGDAE
jgi:hypothetical protein